MKTLNNNKLIAEFMGSELEETLNKELVYALRPSGDLSKGLDFYNSKEVYKQEKLFT